VFVAGGATGVGSMYSVEVVSSGPLGDACKLLDTTVGNVAGYVAPVVIRLAAGRHGPDFDRPEEADMCREWERVTRQAAGAGTLG
jgi:hypothetical protein